MKEKLPYYLSLFILVLAGLLLGNFGYLQFAPLNVVELNESPIKVDKDTYKAGEDVIILLKYNKKLDFKSDKTEYFLSCDGSMTLLTNVGVNRPVGNKIVGVRKTIPINTPSYPCTIIIELDYHITPLRSIFYRWETEKFQVIKAVNE